MICKRFEGRGYGFIKDDTTQNEIFCHFTKLETKNFDDMIIGTKVEFDIVDSGNGTKAAENVKIIERNNAHDASMPFHKFVPRNFERTGSTRWDHPNDSYVHVLIPMHVFQKYLNSRSGYNPYTWYESHQW